jgi:hypothetical protein
LKIVNATNNRLARQLRALGPGLRGHGRAEFHYFNYMNLTSQTEEILNGNDQISSCFRARQGNFLGLTGPGPKQDPIRSEVDENVVEASFNSSRIT